MFFANFTGKQYISGLHNISRTIGFFQQHPVLTRDNFPPPSDPPGLPWPLDTLGLDIDATPQQVKTRFKELVKRHHPDANGGDRSTEDRLVEIIQSYNYLKSVGFG